MENLQNAIITGKNIMETIEFFEDIFPNLKDEFIEVRPMLKGETDKANRKFFNDIGEVVAHISNIPEDREIYYGLGTRAKVGSGKAQDINTFNCLGFDFDLKDDTSLSISKIKERFKKLGIKLGYIINSGNGYHAYILIEPTQNKALVENVLKDIGAKVKADEQALKLTQILRVPYTFNNKNTIKKLVSIQHKDKSNRYNINGLKGILGLPDIQEKKEYTNSGVITKPSIKIDRACVRNMFNGVPEGHRNFALGRLVAYFKQQGYTQDGSWSLAREFNSRNQKPEASNKLRKDFLAYWYGDYKLLGCTIKSDANAQSILSNYCNKESCNNRIRIDSIILENTVDINNRIFNKLDKLSGNAIVIYGLLLRHKEGLSIKQLQEKLTNKVTGKPCISDNTIKKDLKYLVSNGFIQKIDKSFYKVIRQGTFGKGYTLLSNGAINGRIDGRVTPAQIKLYVLLLKYAYSKGECYPSQELLAEKLRIKSNTVCERIQELEKADYIKIISLYNEKGVSYNAYALLV